MPAAPAAPAAADRLTRSQRKRARRAAQRAHHTTAERLVPSSADAAGSGNSPLPKGEGLGEGSHRSGPHTPEGKAAVSQNAVTHGLRSERPVLSSESEEEWEAHLAATVAHYAPRDPLERALAERIALCLWRLGRVTRYETDTSSAWIDRAGTDASKSLRLDRGLDTENSLTAALAAEHRLQHLARSLLPLLAAPTDGASEDHATAGSSPRAAGAHHATAGSPPPPTPIPLPDALRLLERYLSRLARLDHTALDAPLPAADDTSDATPDSRLPLRRRGWTAASLADALTRLARRDTQLREDDDRVARDPVHVAAQRAIRDQRIATQQASVADYESLAAERAAALRTAPGPDAPAVAPADPAAVLEALLASSQERASSIQSDLHRLSRETERLRRQRSSLPEPDVSDRIVRYEGHLTRQLTAALRALTASQSRPLPQPEAGLPSPVLGEGPRGWTAQGSGDARGCGPDATEGVRAEGETTEQSPTPDSSDTSRSSAHESETTEQSPQPRTDPPSPLVGEGPRGRSAPRGGAEGGCGPDATEGVRAESEPTKQSPPSSAPEDPDEPVSESRRFYLAHKQEIDDEADGRYVAIYWGKLSGFHDSLEDARKDVSSFGDYLIILDGDEVAERP